MDVTIGTFTVYGGINCLHLMVFYLILQVIIATGVAFASSLHSVYNIEIVGHIPAGYFFIFQLKFNKK